MQRKPATDKHKQFNVCLFLHKVVHIKLQLKIESWENKFDDLLNVHRKLENAFERLANSFILAISRFKGIILLKGI